MAFARFNQCTPCCTKCELVVGTMNCGSSFEVDIIVRAGPTSSYKIIAATSVIANNQSTIVEFDSGYRNTGGNLVTLDSRGQSFPVTQSSLVFLNDKPCTGSKIFNLYDSSNCCGPCRKPVTNAMVSWNDPTLAEALGIGTSYGYYYGSFNSRVGPVWDHSVHFPCEDPNPIIGPCVMGGVAYSKSIVSNVTSSISIQVETPFFLYTYHSEVGMYGCCYSPCLGPPCSYPNYVPHWDPELSPTKRDVYGLFRMSCFTGGDPSGPVGVVLLTQAVPQGAPPPIKEDFFRTYYALLLDNYSCDPLMLSASTSVEGQVFVEGPFISGVATATIIG